MTQLNDLSDYCLLEVFDRLSPEELFKIQRVSRRMKQLANEKLRTTVKAITLSSTYHNDSFASCSHLGPVSKDRMLFLWDMFEVYIELNQQPKRALFMNLLSKCFNIKSIDFHCFTLCGEVLLKVFRRCPQLECIKLWNLIEIDEWKRFLEQHGNKLVHIIKGKSGEEPTEARQLAMVAEKCLNIKQINWTYDNFPTSDLVTAFKLLDKSCQASLNCINGFANNVFEDVFDELDIWVFAWSQFGDRLDRLSSLKFKLLYYDTEDPNDQIRGIKFNGLKKLDFSYAFGYDQQLVNCLVASRFPMLEEFSFNTIPGFDEVDYKRMFKTLVSVKKLKLFSSISFIANGKCMRLPGSSIYQLKNLEAIELKLTVFSEKWQIKDILEPLEQYADGIESLKKITVDTKSLGQFKEESLIKMIEDEAERLLKRIKLKHNCVEVNLVCYEPPELIKKLSDE